MDADGKHARKLTNAPGCYNGGPFFSPDGKKVIFRSDRKKKDVPAALPHQRGWHGRKSVDRRRKLGLLGPFLVQGLQAHHLLLRPTHSNPPDAKPNYDLYWLNVATGKKVRLTYAPGADVLPVFSPDYTKVMWTLESPDGQIA